MKEELPGILTHARGRESSSATISSGTFRRLATSRIDSSSLRNCGRSGKQHKEWGLIVTPDKFVRRQC